MNQIINFQNGVVFKVIDNGFEVVSVDGSVARFDRSGNLIDGIREMCSGEKINFAHVLTGHYVVYTPTLEKYVVSKEKTGDAEDQIFHPHMHTLWRVFRKDGARLQLIPVKTVGSLALNGVAGFEHGVDALNELSAAFVNPDYAEFGECIGNSSDSRNLNNNMNDFSLEAAVNNVYTDNEWKADYSKLANSYAGSRYKEHIHLASRKTLNRNEALIGQAHCIMEIGPRGGHRSNVLFTISEDGEIDGFRVVAGVVPKITLKPEVKFIDGDGSQESPWRLEV